MNQLLFYQNIVALDRVKHADLQFITPTNFKFAETYNVVPVLLSELDEIMAEFPIVFVPAGNNEFILAALMDFRTGKNAFIKNGVWNGRYIPAFIRRYPFITIPTAGDPSQFMMAIDESSSFLTSGKPKLVGNQEAHPLFDGQEPAKMLASFIPFLQNYHGENLKTMAFCKKIFDLGLISPSNIKTANKDGKEYQVNGVGLIDEKRLNELSDAAVVDLFRTGAMMQIYRLQFSLRNCAILSNKLSADDQVENLADPVKQPVLPAASANAAPVTLKAGESSKAGVTAKASPASAKAPTKPIAKTPTKTPVKTNLKSKKR